MSDRRFQRDPARPCFVISVAAGLVQAHPRTLRIYEDEGLLAPARTPTNIRLYSENDIRRILWIRRLTQERGVNLAGVRLIFDLEERLGTRILEALFDDDQAREAGAAAAATRPEVEAQPTARQVTRIVATRVTSNRSGDPND
jgi:MerR family transcriptional regulator/heat shock protein HspR